MAREPTTGNIEEMEEDDEAEAQHDPTPKWSPFESLMIQKMDVMLHVHEEHSTEVHSSIENINSRLENIETRLKLSNLPNPDEDDAQLCFGACFCCLAFIVVLSSV